jgi:VIT1/CCC1 family predicted Fe2+/Mn2+ transporter
MQGQQQHSDNRGNNSYREHIHLLRRSRLLQRHPVLIPVLLLSGAAILGIASFFSNSLFPILALIGIPSAMFCLSIALMLGIVGILVGIISIIECLYRHSAQATAFSQPKERSYANRN